MNSPISRRIALLDAPHNLAELPLVEPAKRLDNVEPLSRSQVIERGKALYENTIKPLVERNTSESICLSTYFRACTKYTKRFKT